VPGKKDGFCRMKDYLLDGKSEETKTNEEDWGAQTMVGKEKVIRPYQEGSSLLFVSMASGLLSTRKEDNRGIGRNKGPPPERVSRD